MFEAVIALCIDLAEGPCRDQLIPGYAAHQQADCMAALDARPPVLTGLTVKGGPRCAPMGPALEMQEVAPGVFVHMGRIEEPNTTNAGDVANLGFIVGSDSVAVIDTGAARWLGETLWRAIRTETAKPIRYVILTHMHPDHVLGAAPFAEAGAQIIGHDSLPRALADRQANYIESLERLIGPAAFLGSRAVTIDLTVKEQMDLDLGDRSLTVQAWPTAHTTTDVTVLDHATATLFTGDLVFHRHTPALDGKLVGWQAVMAEMAEMNVSHIVPGHGGPVLDWPAGVQDQQRYLAVLARDTRAAIEKGQRLGQAVEEIAQSEAVHWELFDAYNARNATVAFTELEWE